MPQPQNYILASLGQHYWDGNLDRLVIIINVTTGAGGGWSGQVQVEIPDPTATLTNLRSQITTAILTTVNQATGSNLSSSHIRAFGI